MIIGNRLTNIHITYGAGEFLGGYPRHTYLKGNPNGGWEGWGDSLAAALQECYRLSWWILWQDVLDYGYPIPNYVHAEYIMKGPGRSLRLADPSRISVVTRHVLALVCNIVSLQVHLYLLPGILNHVNSLLLLHIRLVVGAHNGHLTAQCSYIWHIGWIVTTEGFSVQMWP